MEESDEEGRKRPRKNPTPRKRLPSMNLNVQPLLQEIEIKKEPPDTEGAGVSGQNDALLLSPKNLLKDKGGQNKRKRKSKKRKSKSPEQSESKSKRPRRSKSKGKLDDLSDLSSKDKKKRRQEKKDSTKSTKKSSRKSTGKNDTEELVMCKTEPPEGSVTGQTAADVLGESVKKKAAKKTKRKGKDAKPVKENKSKKSRTKSKSTAGKADKDDKKCKKSESKGKKSKAPKSKSKRKQDVNATVKDECEIAGKNTARVKKPKKRKVLEGSDEPVLKKSKIARDGGPEEQSVGQSVTGGVCVDTRQNVDLSETDSLPVRTAVCDAAEATATSEEKEKLDEQDKDCASLGDGNIGKDCSVPTKPSGELKGKNTSAVEVETNSTAERKCVEAASSDSVMVVPSDDNSKSTTTSETSSQSKASGSTSLQSSRSGSRSSSRVASREASRPGSPLSVAHGIQGLEDIRLLTEQLTCLNRDSDHLNTVIYRKPTPRKRKKRSMELAKKCLQSTPLRGSPSKGRTPQKSTRSPWKSFSLRITPSRKTPRKTPAKTPGLSPFPSRLSACKGTPQSAGLNESPSRAKRTPSKASIKRRLYSGIISPEGASDSQGNVTPNKESHSDSQPGTDQDTPNKQGFVIDTSEVYSPSLGDRLNIDSGQEDEWEDTLEDIPEEEDLIDKKLEEKSQKIKLTAKNVRSIIHQVITNEHVLDMVRNTLQEDGLESQLKEAIFEPRMTRSKVKEAMEMGKVPLPWTLSPIKGFGQKTFSLPQHFLEMSFSDNEEQDEEYSPSPEDLEHATDDEESICSQPSEVGSPMPHKVSLSAMPSPCSSVASDNLEKLESPMTPSFMGPPLSIAIPNRPKRNLMESSDRETTTTEDEVTIATRTRSKLPLTDTPLEVIESSFVAPDITPDMYDTNCDDKDWRNFLSTLTTTAQTGDLNDTTDEVEDPEYNFLAEAEKEGTEDDEDFRNDKAVKIPKKELDQLMSELFEAYGGADVLDDDTQDSQPPDDQPPPDHQVAQCSVSDTTHGRVEHSSTDGEEAYDKVDSGAGGAYPVRVPPLNLNPQLASIVASDIMRIKSGKKECPAPSPDGAAAGAAPVSVEDLAPGSLTGQTIPRLTEAEIIQLKDQMRKHVQLLTQTFVQAASADNELLRSTQQSTKMLMMELKCMGEKARQDQGHSHLHPPNLEAALELTQQDYSHKDAAANQVLEKHMRTKVMTKKAFNRYGLTYEQMDVFANSTVFLIPQMLPEYMLVGTHEAKTRIAFTDAEDNLLAMGIDQFHHLEKKYVFVHRFLLPTKQREQIRFRHKNLRARAQRNAINFWYREGHLPDFLQYLELEKESDFRTPAQRDLELLPMWFEAYVKTKKELQLDDAHEGDLELPSTPIPSPATASTPNPVPDFKKNLTCTYKKLPRAKKKDDEPLAIAPRLCADTVNSPITVTQIGNGLIVSSPAGVEIHSCPSTPDVGDYSTGDNQLEQQVMDKLMSAIDIQQPPCPVSQPSDIPLVVDSMTMTATTQGTDEPVVMLTASQLKQLGINVDVVTSVSEPLPSLNSSLVQSPFLGPGMAQQYSSSPCASTASIDTATTPTSSSKKSLISHAFSEATGIPLDDLENMTNVSEVLDATTPPGETSCLETSHCDITVLESSILEQPSRLDQTWTTPPEDLLTQTDEPETSLPSHIGDDRQNSPRTLSDQINSEGIHSSSHAQSENVDAEVMEITEKCATENLRNSRSTEERSSETNSHANPDDKNIDDQEKNETASDVIENKTNLSQTPRSETPDGGNVTPPNTVPCSPAGHPNTLHGEASRSSLVEESPSKSAIRVMAELAQLITPQTKVSPIKWPHQHRSGNKFWSPTKSLKSPRKSPLRPLRPFASVITSPVKIDLPKRQGPGRPPRYSPRRKDLNQHARAIAPKGLVVRSFVSPVKMAAATISAKARRKNGPKPAAVRKLRSLLPKEDGHDTEKATFDGDFYSLDDEDAARSHFRRESDGELMGENLSDLEDHLGGNDSQPDEDLEDEADEDEDRLAKLMAASITVRGPPKKTGVLNDPKNTKNHKKKATLELLAPDLVENDPRRDERDTAFAQGYLHKVRDVLRNDPAKYEEFLKLLYDFGSSDSTPVQLYENVQSLLADQPDLVSDFAGFLLPDQAKVCGCLMENLGFKRAREFLRKIEVFFHKQPQHLQRILKAFSQWHSKPRHEQDPTTLRAVVRPLLRGQQHLLDEFTMFFENERPPDSYKTEFEEVTLGDSDEEDSREYDSYEEVEFPDGDDADELYGTKLCPCTCHNVREPKFARRRAHCQGCSVRVIRGQVYMQKNERDVYLISPAIPPESPEGSTVEDFPINEKNPSDEEGLENIPPNQGKPRKRTKLKVKFCPKPRPASSRSSLKQSTSGTNSSEQEVKVETLGGFRSEISKTIFSGEEALLSPEPLDGTTSQMARPVPGQEETGPTDFSGLRQEIQMKVEDEDEEVKEVITDTDQGEACIVEGQGFEEHSENSRSTIYSASNGSDDANSRHTADNESNDTSCSPKPNVDSEDDEDEQDADGDDEDEGDEDDMDEDELTEEDEEEEEEEDPSINWTREEDRQILEICQREGTGVDTFQNIADALENKTPQQVMRRFMEMMQMLSEDEDVAENGTTEDGQ